MALNIKDPETDQLARRLAAATGETVTEAVRNAVREKLYRLPQKDMRRLAEDVRAIGRRCAALPDLDRRSAEEILGYDEHGAPF